MINMVGNLARSCLAFICNPDNWQLDQDTEINIPEVTSEIDLNDVIHHNTSSSEQIRFGQSEDESEIQQCENLLSHAKFEVDTDRMLVNREQAEVDNAHFRLSSLSDQISHEPNLNLAHSYQSEMSDVETELKSHERKLEQARADLAVDQQAEYDAEDKLRETLNQGN